MDLRKRSVFRHAELVRRRRDDGVALVACVGCVVVVSQQCGDGARVEGFVAASFYGRHGRNGSDAIRSKSFVLLEEPHFHSQNSNAQGDGGSGAWTELACASDEATTP